MKILLINNNPSISRLITLSAEKQGYTLTEVTSLDSYDGQPCDVAFIDDEDYNDSIATMMKQMELCKHLSYITRKIDQKPEIADSALKKPFLPTDFAEKMEEIVKIIKPEEKEAPKPQIQPVAPILNNEEEEDIVLPTQNKPQEEEKKGISFNLDGDDDIQSFAIKDEANDSSLTPSVLNNDDISEVKHLLDENETPKMTITDSGPKISMPNLLDDEEDIVLPKTEEKEPEDIKKPQEITKSINLDDDEFCLGSLNMPNNPQEDDEREEDKISSIKQKLEGLKKQESPIAQEKQDEIKIEKPLIEKSSLLPESTLNEIKTPSLDIPSTPAKNDLDDLNNLELGSSLDISDDDFMSKLNEESLQKVFGEPSSKPSTDEIKTLEKEKQEPIEKKPIQEENLRQAIAGSIANALFQSDYSEELKKLKIKILITFEDK